MERLLIRMECPSHFYSFTDVGIQECMSGIMMNVGNVTCNNIIHCN